MTTTVPLAPGVQDRVPPSARPPRFALAPVGSAPALVDGAWWPRSRDLTAELPALVEALDPLWGRITRVTVNPSFWPVVPPRVPVSGHVVRVGWFRAEQDPHKLLLLSYTVGRWDLLIIPPQTDPATAAWLMAAAGDPSRSLTASALLREADAFRTGAEEAAGADGLADRLADGLGDRLREAVWETEGGRVARHPGSRLPAGALVEAVPVRAGAR
ncbi:DUF5994 family protein [Streptomyces tagetis]|uniref:Uncharacterized protein n=1 Tax=Streptomyces tagetis TaxID=2820809 RepID=A0A940XJA9_9ACTN|nr:DUF5994 family protein [Streptomyces sp. RG38]MBQ0827571.1 hypothetical protein [Streptomyces sp. RG38]